MIFFGKRILFLTFSISSLLQKGQKKTSAFFGFIFFCFTFSRFPD